MAAAVDKGAIQIGNMGLPPFSKAFENGLQARIIGSTIIRKLDIFLVSQPEIKNIADLKGKRIGILSLGSCDNYFTRYMLGKEFINPTDQVELIPLGRSYGNLGLITTRAVDATFLVEPKVTLGKSKNILNILACVGDYFPRYQWNVIFARDGFIKENDGLIHDILNAYRKSVLYIIENPQEAVIFGSRLFKIRKDIFKRTLNRTVGTWETEARIDTLGMANAIQIQKEIGALGPDFRMETMIEKV